MALEYKTDRRSSFIPQQENITVSLTFPYTADLKEIPDLAANVTIPSMTRVYAMPQNSGEFFVHRSGLIYFHAQDKGRITTVNYMGGGSRLRADDWNEMVDTLTRIESLHTGITSIMFGDVDLRVVPSNLTSSLSVLNNSTSGSFQITFTISLVNLNNIVYEWINDIPVYISINSAFVDADIEDPVFVPASGDIIITGGVATTVATYDTDAGTYKAYTNGDSLNFTFTTVDPTSLVGLSLAKTVVDSIQ